MCELKTLKVSHLYFADVYVARIVRVRKSLLNKKESNAGQRIKTHISVRTKLSNLIMFLRDGNVHGYA